MSEEEILPKFKMTPEAQEDLQKQLNEWFNTVFKEKYVVIECPYALAVEYGTTPSKAGGSAVPKVKDPETGQEITQARLDFRNWIEKKEGVTGKERVRRGDLAYKKVMQEGMKPHPYIRPAVEDMKRTLMEDAMGATSEEEVTMAYANFLAARMKYYLNSNKNDVTDALTKSIRVAPALMAEMARNVNEVDLDENKYHWKPGQARK